MFGCRRSIVADTGSSPVSSAMVKTRPATVSSRMSGWSPSDARMARRPLTRAASLVSPSRWRRASPSASPDSCRGVPECASTSTSPTARPPVSNVTASSPTSTASSSGTSRRRRSSRSAPSRRPLASCAATSTDAMGAEPRTVTPPASLRPSVSSRGASAMRASSVSVSCSTRARSGVGARVSPIESVSARSSVMPSKPGRRTATDVRPSWSASRRYAGSSRVAISRPRAYPAEKVPMGPLLRRAPVPSASSPNSIDVGTCSRPSRMSCTVRPPPRVWARSDTSSSSTSLTTDAWRPDSSVPENDRPVVPSMERKVPSRTVTSSPPPSSVNCTPTSVGRSVVKVPATSCVPSSCSARRAPRGAWSKAIAKRCSCGARSCGASSGAASRSPSVDGPGAGAASSLSSACSGTMAPVTARGAVPSEPTSRAAPPAPSTTPARKVRGASLVRVSKPKR